MAADHEKIAGGLRDVLTFVSYFDSEGFTNDNEMWPIGLRIIEAVPVTVVE